MREDTELLSRYAADHSEADFAELIRRHMDLVYSAALRLTGGDFHRAQDVTQLVFSELARQANRLRNHPALVGWLYTTTRWVALRVRRTEQRRQAREQEAHTMIELLREPDSESNGDDLFPVLEEAMHELGATDRHAVLLRFFKNKSLNEVGLALGLSDNAARMRVDRALDKLRLQLARKGVTSTAAALASTLSVKAVTAAPAGLAATLLTTSTAAVAVGTGTTLTLLKKLAMTKLQLTFTALLIAGATTTLVIQHHTQERLREENQALQQQNAQLQSENAGLSDQFAQTKKAREPRPAVPPMQIATKTPSPMGESQATNLYTRFGNEPPKLTAEQVEVYLKANGRKAASLLAAYRTSGNAALLKEAMQNFPSDPKVAFEAILKGDLTPEQRRQWLNNFEQTAPDNALANYLSARDYLKAGQTDQAVQELMAASGKRQFQDYTLERAQNDAEAYLAAGYSAAASKLIGSQVELPQLLELKQLGQQMVDLSSTYRQVGDQASAQAVLQIAASLGQSYGAGSAGDGAISHLVGLAIERNALSAMNPNSPYGDGGQTVQDRLNQIAQQKEMFNALVQQSEPLLQTMPDQDWISYIDRIQSFGEEAAMRWLVTKHGQK